MAEKGGERRARVGRTEGLRADTGGILSLLAGLLIVALLSASCAAARVRQARAPEPAPVPSGEASVSSEAPSEQEPPANIAYLEMSAADLSRGDLILVNREHTFDAALAEGVTSVRDGRLSDIQENSFATPIGTTMLTALEDMQRGMVAAMSDGMRLLVNAGYRTAQSQQDLIDEYTESKGEEYVARFVAPVGASEHHTALAADISFYDTAGGKVLATTSPDAAAYYSWCLANCGAYGLVLRYTAEKEAVTGYSAESWHFRYVGVPHALYMNKMGLCLEEYLDELKTTSFGDRLYIPAEDGRVWSVYYAPTDSPDGSSHLPVPRDAAYTVSGNNADGYIVTVQEPLLPEGARTVLAQESSGSASGDSQPE